MTPGATFERIVRLVARRPTLVLVAGGLLAGAAIAVALTQLRASAAPETLVDADSESARATERFERQFGSEPVMIIVQGDLGRTLMSDNLERLVALEDCLAGKRPHDAASSRGGGTTAACDALSRTDTVRAVYGPGNFVETAADQLVQGLEARRAQLKRDADAAAREARERAAQQGAGEARQSELAAQARAEVRDRFVRETAQLALRYGLTELPSRENPTFVSQLVFDRTASGDIQPKPRFAYLFPSGRAAVIQVRLRPGISNEEQAQAITLVREIVALPRFQLAEGLDYAISGVPVVVEDLAAEVQRAVVVLLISALLVMTATLLLVFRTRLRLLPLALALVAAALTFGGVALLGGSLTMASIAALPVLIGLAVDYAIQFQARFDEARAAADGDAAPRGGTAASGEAAADDGDAGWDRAARAAAAIRAAGLGGPTIATAGLASALGFLVLLLSPVPMVRGFGLVVAAGIAIAFVCTLTLGFAALARFSGRGRRGDAAASHGSAADSQDSAADPHASGSGSRGWGAEPARSTATRSGRFDAARRRAGELGSSALRLAIAQPRKVILIGAALAVLGWGVDSQISVISDVTQLVPADMKAVQGLQTLQQATGVAGVVNVTLRAEDLTRPEVLKWAADFQRRVLAANGYRPGTSCGQEQDPPDLCPGPSLTDLVSASVATDAGTARGLLDALPPYFSDAVISRDRRVANLSFGIRLIPLERQKEVIDDLRAALDPPAGVEATVAGTPVLVAEGNAALASPWRRLLTHVAGLSTVLLVLLLVRRRLESAVVPLIPIVLATGWSSLVLFVLRIPLNPMSATLGLLVIAISTEFSVLLSARYGEERAAGAEPAAALKRTFESTGAAVLASGTTAIAGFAALIASDIRMLRDFGIVTVVDLSVALVGVMLVLPAALMWAEEHGPFKLRDLDPRRPMRRLRAGRAT